MMAKTEEKKTKKIDVKKLVETCVKIAEDRKALDVVSLELSEMSVIADFFVCCTGNTTPHIKAISDNIAKGLKEQFNIRPASIDGTPASSWIVMDYSSVIISDYFPDITCKRIFNKNHVPVFVYQQT